MPEAKLYAPSSLVSFVNSLEVEEHVSFHRHARLVSEKNQHAHVLFLFDAMALFHHQKLLFEI
jgi:hypothetical protein